MVLNDLSEKERKILEMRHGLMDGIYHTLEEVGREFGVTRERVRQVCSRVERLLQNQRPFTPVLDRVLKIIEGFSFTSADEIEAQ